MNKKYFMYFVFFFFISSQQVFAADCVTLPPALKAGNQMVSNAVKKALDGTVKFVTNILEKSFQSMQTVNNVNTATIVKAIESLQASNIRSVEAQVKIENDLRNEAVYTGDGTQPSNTCGGAIINSGKQVSKRTQLIVKKDMRKKQLEYANTSRKPVAYVKRIVSDKHPSIEEMSKSFMPTKTTLSEKEFAIANETLKTVSNPIPLPVISKEMSNKMTKKYEISRNIYQMGEQNSINVLVSHLAYHAPTYPEEVSKQVLKQWQAANPSNPPATVDDVPGMANGKMSEAGMLEFQSQLRFGNPNYSSEVASLRLAGLLRELIKMQAIEYEIDLKNNELLSSTIGVMLNRYTMKNNNTKYQKLHDLYVQTIGIQQ